MTELNITGILVATVAGMILGALWYSSLLFGNAWMKCIGKTPDTLGKPTVPMIGSVIASLLSATGVALMFSLIDVSSLPVAIGTVLILGLLIIFPALLSDNLFCGWGARLLVIQSGYRAASVILMSLAMHYV